MLNTYSLRLAHEYIGIAHNSKLQINSHCTVTRKEALAALRTQ